VERVEKAPLPRVAPGPWLRFARQGRFHPLKYLAGLAAALRRRGGLIFTRARAETIEGGTRARVRCRGGPVVTADAVVVATNTPLNSGVSLNSKLAAYTTYALAAPVPNVPLDALFWDTEDPYHYVRYQPDGTRGEAALIVGGEDHKTGQATDQKERWARLEGWARERCPEMGPVRHRWSGQVVETLDGLAHIGRDPEGRESVWLATGDSGMGMTHGTIAGLLLADLIQGRSNPWQDLFAPDRLPLSAAGTYLSENFNMARQFADWVTGSDVSSVDEIDRARGAVLRRGLKKLAVYRDQKGQLHRRSATCPHMGCVVHWNRAEKSWDCPCHGSRFGAEGKVTHGPAVDDLEVIAD
jgi:glycine/D-amino acid oxidase-like deaminating enzyme/nitrite reductase/ring-hydroxylating ferredoxin subunit